MSRAAGGWIAGAERNRGGWMVAGMLWALFTAGNLWFASNAVPAIDGDAVYFIPTAHSIRTAGTWLSPAAIFLDPMYSPGTAARYVYHGWLYPFAVAHLAPESSWNGIFLSRAIVSSLTFGAVILCALPVLRTAWAATVMTIVAAAVVGYASGRPETLAMPLLMLLAWRILYRKPSVVLDGSVLGLLFASQPTICMTAATGYCLYRLLHEPLAFALASILAVGTLAVAVALLLFLLIYPYSLADWIAGIANQAGMLASRSEWGGFWRYYVADPTFPLLAVPIAGAATLLLLSSLQRGEGGASRALPALAATLFLALLLFGALKVPPTLYNVMPWLLVFSWHALARLEAAQPHDPWRSWIAVGALAVLSLSSLSGLVRGTIQNGVSSTDRHASLEAGREVVRRVLASCRNVRVNFPLVALLGPDASSARVRYADQPRRAGESVAPDPPDAILQTQYRADADAEPRIPGMTLVYSSYAHSFRIPGLPLFNTPTAHNFAVLLRTGSPCLARFAGQATLPAGGVSRMAGPGAWTAKQGDR